MVCHLDRTDKDEHIEHQFPDIAPHHRDRPKRDALEKAAVFHGCHNLRRQDSILCRAEACDFHNGGNHALHDFEQSHHQLQVVSDRNFHKGEADEQLQGVFELLHACEVAADTHQADDKEQHEQGKPYRLQHPVDMKCFAKCLK